MAVPLMIEYEAVLMRADHRTVSGLSVDDVGGVPHHWMPRMTWCLKRQ
jgi:hypothetical protein